VTAHKALGGGLRISKTFVKGKALAKVPPAEVVAVMLATSIESHKLSF
jgi:hypothetical protein